MLQFSKVGKREQRIEPDIFRFNVLSAVVFLTIHQRDGSIHQKPRLACPPYGCNRRAAAGNHIVHNESAVASLGISRNPICNPVLLLFLAYDKSPDRSASLAKDLVGDGCGDGICAELHSANCVKRFILDEIEYQIGNAGAGFGFGQSLLAVDVILALLSGGKAEYGRVACFERYRVEDLQQPLFHRSHVFPCDPLVFLPHQSGTHKDSLVGISKRRVSNIRNLRIYSTHTDAGLGLSRLGRLSFEAENQETGSEAGSSTCSEALPHPAINSDHQGSIPKIVSKYVLKLSGVSRMNEFAELVFGLVYPVGADVDPVVDALDSYLAQLGYKSEKFRISDHLRSLSLGISFDDADPLGLMHALMNAGNEARKRAESDDILAVAALNDIFRKRGKDERGGRRPSNNVVHIIRSFKRPEEVKLVRDVYRPGFFLVGIAADDEEQITFLVDKRGLTRDQAQDLIKRDQEEDKLHGQRTRKTFYLADVFVQLCDKQYEKQLRRFLDLVFGAPFCTPRREEHAMFMAYASAARSAQLGRQVGAAVATAEGEVLAVGFNEVPKSGGGPYWDGDEPDHRDHTKTKDPNHEHRFRIIGSIVERLKEKLFFEESIKTLVEAVLRSEIGERELHEHLESAMRAVRSQLINETTAIGLIESSDLKEITEYGRGVHAEMDAILTCARIGIGVKGKILFTTTFPCHNCTRHVIASGISKVVYIEPYPKSKSKDLHEDAITFDLEDAEKTGKIPFVPFVGIGPRRYLDFFSLQLSTGYDIERKAKDGKPAEWSWRIHKGPRVPMRAYSYIEREEKLISERSQQLKRILEESRG